MQPEDIAFLLVLLLVVGAGAFLAWGAPHNVRGFH